MELNLDKFKLVGGHPALDMVNTVGERPIANGPEDPALRQFKREKLENFVDLVSWNLKAGLLDAGEAAEMLNVFEGDRPYAAKLLKRFIILRETVYRLLKAGIGGWESDSKDLEKFNSELLTARKNEKLTQNAGGSYLVAWEERSPERIVWTAAKTAAEFLTSANFERLRNCANDDCGWLFLDESRGHNRQWCDMKDCGNAAKVRRFRNKKADI